MTINIVTAFIACGHVYWTSLSNNCSVELLCDFFYIHFINIYINEF